MNRWFIAGTDTGIGKTYTACAFIRHLADEGQAVAVMKPVASGCERNGGDLKNEDALALMAAANVRQDYGEVNPFAYGPAIAPHIAAKQAGRPVEIEEIVAGAEAITADHLVIEGAGGWCVPLDDRQLFPELVRRLGARVILVVGMKLGCINHALLSAGRIRTDGCDLVGWIANQLDPEMPVYEENLESLSSLMPVPLLAEIPFGGQNLAFGEKTASKFSKSGDYY